MQPALLPEDDTQEAENAPHYKGHRDRLRERFLRGGTDALAPYEVLEILLFMAIPRRDVKPLAKSLLSAFGSLAGVFHATPDELRRAGLTDSSIAAVKLVRAASLHLLEQDVMNKPVLNSWNKLLAYLQATMGHEKKEHFRILFLNKKNELIADEIQQSGTIDHTPAYPREIVKRALELSATALILVHNHPSGDTTPSKDDIVMTERVIAAAKPIGITVHDHLIVSKNNVTSMKNKGII